MRGVGLKKTPPPDILVALYSDPVLILRLLVSAPFPVMSIHSPLGNMARSFLTEVPFHPKEYCFQNLSSLILSLGSEKNLPLQLHLFSQMCCFWEKQNFHSLRSWTLKDLQPQNLSVGGKRRKTLPSLTMSELPTGASYID